MVGEAAWVVRVVAGVGRVVLVVAGVERVVLVVVAVMAVLAVMAVMAAMVAVRVAGSLEGPSEVVSLVAHQVLARCLSRVTERAEEGA